MNYLLSLFTFSLLFYNPLRTSAQQQPSPVGFGPDAPDWARLLQAPDSTINVFEIQRLYKRYYDEHAFKKSTYTQLYKRWMHWARPYVQADGRLHLPTVKEEEAQEALFRRWRKQAGKADPDAQKPAGWTFLGPNQTYDTDGVTEVTWQTNIYAFDIAPSDPKVLYAGGESGGLWRTTDKGLHWTLLSAGITHGSFGAVKIHPTNPDICYAATSGKIVKTVDGGANWTTVYSENSLWVNDIAISAADPNIVLGASDQGLLRSTNGGANWTKYFTNKTWAVEFKVGDPNTVFAVRKNGNGSDLMKSTNGGASFVASNSGWYTPTGQAKVDGVMLATCPSNPSKIYAFLTGSGDPAGGSNDVLGGFIGVYRSNNSGASWANTNPSNTIGQPYTMPNHTNLMDANGVDWFYQGFYDMAIVVNPTNENELIAGGCSWFKSTDGGATWPGLGGYVGSLDWSHPDIQAAAASGNDLWIASDGGLNYSTDFAQTITARMNGISGSDMWGFDSGWNEDILVGGRYHNGNMAWHESFPAGKFLRMGGAESPTGYVSPGPERKTYFSDIGNYKINGGLDGNVSYFGDSPVYPNESYAYYANSEMEWHPACWNVIYLGHENKIWRSDDGGASFTALYAFPGNADNTVYEIEISRADPQVLYCSQWDGTDDAIWRSADGGLSWQQCTALPLPNNNDRVKLAVSAENPNVLWVALTYGSNGKKIYKTVDGGQSWQNLTTATLNNFRISGIMAQYGTDGGIYVGGDGGVFYRNNSLADWQFYAQGLPLSAETNRLKPFYKEGKIRNGCWGFGVWESPLYETSAVEAQAMASALDVHCARDTVYFDDHSVVLHAGAAWSWQFPGAAYVAGENTRQPRVLFGQPGSYLAIMALSTPQGQFYDTLSIRVQHDCAADSVPGQAVRLGGNADPGAVALPPLNVSTNQFSVTAWIKPDGIQPDYSSIFMHDGDAAGFNFREGNNTLGYHWPNGQWWWDSGLTVPSGQWSHVAMVVEPTGITLYLNGKGVKHSFSPELVNFSSARLGNYHGWGDRYVKGDLDEVCVYNRALSQAEVREKMHLRKIPADETAMLAYYQFNEAGGSRAFDRSGVLHGSLTGSAARIRSTAPMGPGLAVRKTMSSGKRHDFDAAGLTLAFASGAMLPAGEVVLSRLDIGPDTLPANVPATARYWILDNYGTNATFSKPLQAEFKGLGIPADVPPASCKLWRRVPANADGPGWSQIASADYAKPGDEGVLRFGNQPGIDRAGQFFLGVPGFYASDDFQSSDALVNGAALDRNGTPYSSDDLQSSDEGRVDIYPNPAPGNGTFSIKTDLEGLVRFRLYDEKGRAIRVLKFEGQAVVSAAGLKAGAYTFSLENERFLKVGRVVVE